VSTRSDRRPRCSPLTTKPLGFRRLSPMGICPRPRGRAFRHILDWPVSAFFSIPFVGAPPRFFSFICISLFFFIFFIFFIFVSSIQPRFTSADTINAVRAVSYSGAARCPLAIGRLGDIQCARHFDRRPRLATSNLMNYAQSFAIIAGSARISQILALSASWPFQAAPLRNCDSSSMDFPRFIPIYYLRDNYVLLMISQPARASLTRRDLCLDSYEHLSKLH
jgi:hypothetical protein